MSDWGDRQLDLSAYGLGMMVPCLNSVSIDSPVSEFRYFSVTSVT